MASIQKDEMGVALCSLPPISLNIVAGPAGFPLSEGTSVYLEHRNQRLAVHSWWVKVWAGKGQGSLALSRS